MILSKTIISLQEICVNQSTNVCSRYELEVAMQRITVVPRLSSVYTDESRFFIALNALAFRAMVIDLRSKVNVPYNS